MILTFQLYINNSPETVDFAILRSAILGIFEVAGSNQRCAILTSNGNQYQIKGDYAELKAFLFPPDQCKEASFDNWLLYKAKSNHPLIPDPEAN